MIPTLTDPLGAKFYKRRLQYLYSSNSPLPWIDSGYVPDRAGFEIKLTAHLSPISGGDRYWFGFRLRRNGSASEGVNCAYNTTGIFSSCGGSGGNVIIAMSYLSDPVTVSLDYAKTGDDSYTCTMSANGQTRTKSTLTQDDFIAPGITLPLFSMKMYDSDTREELYRSSQDVKIIRFEIFDAGGNPVRNMIPVLDWNDEACMFDTVTRRFYRRAAGTSQFLYE